MNFEPIWLVVMVPVLLLAYNFMLPSKSKNKEKVE